MTPTGETHPLVDAEAVGKATVARIHGEIDLQRSLPLQRELMTLMDRRPSRLALDLSDVPYMDSSGIASLVKIMARAKRDGVTMTLFGLGDRVRSLFEITRLDNVFTLCNDQQEALE